MLSSSGRVCNLISTHRQFSMTSCLIPDLGASTTTSLCLHKQDFRCSACSCGHKVITFSLAVAGVDLGKSCKTKVVRAWKSCSGGITQAPRFRVL
ncbi:hypothetical protein BAE44_0011155, partial [Dichanthelium oligosanthes]